MVQAYGKFVHVSLEADAEFSAGGIVLTTFTERKQRRGTVLSVGQTAATENPDLVAGATVFFETGPKVAALNDGTLFIPVASILWVEA